MKEAAFLLDLKKQFLVNVLLTMHRRGSSERPVKLDWPFKQC